MRVPSLKPSTQFFKTVSGPHGPGFDYADTGPDLFRAETRNRNPDLPGPYEQSYT